MQAAAEAATSALGGSHGYTTGVLITRTSAQPYSDTPEVASDYIGVANQLFGSHVTAFIDGEASLQNIGPLPKLAVASGHQV